MARLPRLAVAGHVHHVLQRGNNMQPIFIDDED
jgi:putative transposase